MKLDKIIYNLPDTDARKAWWLHLLELLNDGKVSLACSLLLAHNRDADYAEQCYAIVQYIANLGDKA